MPTSQLQGLFTTVIHDVEPASTSQLQGLFTTVVHDGSSPSRVEGLFTTVIHDTSPASASQLQGLFTTVVAPDTTSANASDITGNVGQAATFDGTPSVGDAFLWDWQTVPGGGGVANAKIPVPDNKGAWSIFNNNANVLNMHLSEVSGATPVEFPDNDAATPINMTDNELLVHFTSGLLSKAVAADTSGAGGQTFIPQPSVMNGPNAVTGQLGVAAEYDGSTQYHTRAHSDNLNFTTGNFSVACWIKSDPNQVAWATILQKRTSNNGTDGWTLQFNSNSDHQIRFYVYDTSWRYVEVNIDDRIWNHVVAVRDGTSLKLYLNGQLADTESIASSLVSGGNSPMTLAAANNGGAKYKGLLDEVAVWSRALSEAEVRNAYRLQLAGAGKDSTGESSHMKVIGTPSFVTGQVGNGVQFNGTDQGMQGILATPPGAEGTISGWIRLDATPQDYDHVFGLCASPQVSYRQARALLVRSNRKLYFYGVSADEDNISDPIPLNTWTHVALTWTNTNELKAYTDGVLYKSWTTSTLDLPVASTFIAKIPENYNGVGGFTEKYAQISVDELAFFNVALSDKEIEYLYKVQDAATYAAATRQYTFTPQAAGTYTARLRAINYPADTEAHADYDAVISAGGEDDLFHRPFQGDKIQELSEPWQGRHTVSTSIQGVYKGPGSVEDV